jgi:RND family efflux transporter MFP subunit
MKLEKILAVVLSVGIIGASLSGCGKSEETEATEAEGTNVTVETVAKRSIEKSVLYTGELKTSDNAVVTSKVSAKIKSVKADIGDFVKKGDVLLELDSSDYEYALRQAQANYNQAVAACTQAEASYAQVEASQKTAELSVSSAEAGVSSAESGYNTVTNGTNEQTTAQLKQALSAATIAYNDAKNNYDRQEQLYNMGAISLVAFESAKSALDNASLALETAKKNYDLGVNVLTVGNAESAESGVKTAQIGVEQAKASVEQAKASLKSAQAAKKTAQAAKEAAELAVEQAKDNISNTKITAPISGYVSLKTVSLGQIASPGVTLFEINAADNLEAEIQVTESVVAHVSVGDKAYIDISSSNISKLEGYVSVVNPVKNASGMYTVRVSVPNDDEKLRVGMFADITLITDESVDDSLSLPATSLLQDDDGYYVYVVSGNTAEKRRVETGVTDGEYTLVTKGVQEGEKVVVEGKEYLSETNNIVNVVE